MRLTRIGTVVAAVTATFTLATPAFAIFSGGASASCGYSQTCSGAAQDIPGVGSAGTDVAVNCNAQTPYTVQATIVRCYIWGNNGDKHYTSPVLTQGQASSLAYRFNARSDNLTSRSYILCVGAGYYSTGGTYFGPTNYACNTGV
jgi:hypothetical protein